MIARDSYLQHLLESFLKQTEEKRFTGKQSWRNDF